MLSSASTLASSRTDRTSQRAFNIRFPPRRELVKRECQIVNSNGIQYLACSPMILTFVKMATKKGNVLSPGHGNRLSDNDRQACRFCQNRVQNERAGSLPWMSACGPDEPSLNGNYGGAIRGRWRHKSCPGEPRGVIE